MKTNNWLTYDPAMDQLSEKTQSLLQEAIESTKEFIKVTPELSNTNYYTRGAHAKTYAYVNAYFSPHQETIRALHMNGYFFEQQKMGIRFSNANNVIDSDKKNFPAYGMSIVFENDIYYPLVNFPLFPTDDVDSFLELFIDLNQARIAQAQKGWQAITEIPSLLTSTLKAFYHINPLNLGNLLWKGATLDQNFLLNYSYHGIGAYRFGDYVAKLHTQKKDFIFNEDIFTSNVQKDNLQHILNKESISFKIYIQVATNEEDTPVNVLSKEWSQEKSPWLIFGTVHIPQQEVLENNKDLEAVSFNPFFNPKELHPVGRIQQTRKDVYHIASNTRSELNRSL